MADYIYKEEADKGMNPMTVAFLGAIAGAVGTGVVMALSNPKNRQKVQHTMKDGQQWVDKTMKQFKSTANDMGESMNEAADKIGKDAESTISEAKSSRGTSMK